MRFATNCKLIILIVMALFWITPGAAQIQEEYYQSFLSPNAASLYRFNNVPVNTYNGLINLGIPLFDIEEDYTTLSLALNYHSGGNKVEDIAPWTGLGWNLTGIPQISRQVRGLPDEEDGGTLSLYNGKTLAQYNEGMTLSEEVSISLAVGQGLLDTELDVYYLSINGFSGRFYYDQASAKFITEKVSNIQIQYNRSTSQFQVTDENGIIYVFDVREYAIMNTGGKHVTTSWLPGKISFPSSAGEILFTYNQESHGYMKKATQSRYIFLYPEGGLPPPNIQDNYDDYHAITKAVTLSTITYSKGKLTFVRGSNQREDLNGGYALKKIVVSDKAGQKVKEIALDHFYQSGSGTSHLGANKWMFLSRVDILDVLGGGNPESYRMEYEGKTPPSRLSHAQDYWGYFNNQTGNTSLLPTTSYVHPVTGQTFNVTGANRLVNESYVDFGILKKITYPTGGYSSFTYESNRVNQPGVPTGYAQKMAYIAGEEDPNFPVQPSHMEYVEYFSIDNPPDSYLNNNNANGGAFLQIKVDDLGVPPETEGATLYLKGISSTNSHVNLVFYEDRSSYYVPNGEYELKAVFDQDPPLYMGFQCTVKWYVLNTSLQGNKLTGGLRVKEVKNYSTGNELASHTEYRYVHEWDDETSSGKLFGPADLGFGSYVYKSGWYHETGSNVSFISGANYFMIRALPNYEMVAQNAAYTGYASVYEIRKAGDVSTAVQSLYSNTPDDVYPGPPFLPVQSYSEHNGKLLESRQYSLPDGVPKLLSKQVYSYTFSNDLPAFYNFYPNYYERFGMESNPGTDFFIPVMYPYLFERLNAKLDEKQAYVYDSDQGVIEEKEEYDYNTNHQLVEKVKTESDGTQVRSKYFYPNTLSLSGPYEDARIWMVGKNMFNKVLKEESYRVDGSNEVFLRSGSLFYREFNNIPDAVFMERSEFRSAADPTDVSFFRFLSYDTYGNPLEVSKQDGPTTVYLWGYGGQYPIAKIENASYTDVLTVLGGGSSPTDHSAAQAILDNLNSITVSESMIHTVGGTLRSDPLMAKALISTYTYRPLMGMASMTDPSDRTVYYEYDGFGRLSTVRDQDGFILETYCYNYEGQQVDCGEGGAEPTVYSSAAKSGTFTKDDCTGFAEGSAVIYTVPAGTYSSTESQAAADALAQADVDANGQAYANVHGTCEPEMKHVTILQDPYWQGEITQAVFVTADNDVYEAYPGSTPDGGFDVPAGIYAFVVFYTQSMVPPGYTFYLSFVRNAIGERCVEIPDSSYGPYVVLMENVDMTGLAHELYISPFCY